MSGRLTDGARELLTTPDLLTGLPVFAGHGVYDDTIPIEYGHQIINFWSDLPVELEHHEYPMGHEISPAELTHIQQWLHSLKRN